MSGTSIKIFRTDNGPCPYLEKRNWENISFQTSKIQPDGYISAEDYGEMRALGMDDPKEYERLKNLSVEELMEERVADILFAIIANDTMLS